MKKLYWLFFLPFFTTAQPMEVRWLKELHTQRSTTLDPTMQWVSHSAYAIGFAYPVGMIAHALFQPDSISKRKAMVAVTAACFNTVATYAIKRAVHRDRPAQQYSFIVPSENDRSYSFPSGHTSNAFCTATSLSLNYPKWYVIAPSLAWATAVGYSRMHLGMHYPSDVLAGAVLGAGSAYVSYAVMRWYHKSLKNKIRKR